MSEPGLAILVPGLLPAMSDHKLVTAEQLIKWFKGALGHGPFPDEASVAPLVQAINEWPIAMRRLGDEESARVRGWVKIINDKTLPAIDKMRVIAITASKLRSELQELIENHKDVRRAHNDAKSALSGDPGLEMISSTVTVLIDALDDYLQAWPPRRRGRATRSKSVYWVAGLQTHVVNVLKAAGSRRLALATPDSPTCAVLAAIANQVYGMRGISSATFIEINKENARRSSSKK